MVLHRKHHSRSIKLLAARAPISMSPGQMNHFNSDFSIE